MNRPSLDVIFSLCACIFLTACDGSSNNKSDENDNISATALAAAEQQPSSVADLFGSDAATLFSDDPASSKSEFLTTGASNTSASFWMCTFTQDGLYLNRSELRFNLDGSGAVGASTMDWAEQLGLILVEGETETFSLVNMEFGFRLYTADMFTADVTNGQVVNCDWTGLPRTGQLLNDPTDNLDATDEEIFVDAIISTGIDISEQDTYWTCQFANASKPVEIFYFFANGRYLATSQGRWGPSGPRDIFLQPESSDPQVWSDIEFDEPTEVGYTRFSALSSIDGDVECSIGGKPKAEVYVP